MIKIILSLVAILAFVAGLWTVALTIHFRSQPVASAQRFAPSKTEAKVDTSKTAPAPVPTAISIEAAKGMLSFDYKWRKDGFGTIMIVDWTFTNRSPYDAKDITVTCTHFAPSGTEIDSNTRTIYEIVPANGKKLVKDFNMGFIHSQATSTVCKIDDFDM